MAIDSNAVITKAEASIDELRTAFSHSNCVSQHTEILRYCRASLECGAIDSTQWKELVNLANVALANWRPAPEHADLWPDPAA